MRWTLDDIKSKGLKVGGTATNKPAIPQTSKQRYEALGRMKVRAMNKTESAYCKYLEIKKQQGEVIWYEFEPMNLRLADKCFYKVDFLILTKDFQLEVHEVKGGFITDDALVKIKTAAAKFPFKFIIVQLKNKEWSIREF